jgi:hypothetical protein
VKIGKATTSICTSNVKALLVLIPDGPIVDRLVEKFDNRQNETLLLFRHFQQEREDDVDSCLR